MLTVNNTKADTNIKNIIAIGSSTGGPKALQQIIPLIPAGLPAAVIIVQHMPVGFTNFLAERLDGMSELLVKEGEDSELIKPGCAYIAPGDYHMTVGQDVRRRLKLKVSKEPPVGGHRPSVDKLFSSLAGVALKNLMAVVLTGMGKDGTQGLKEIKKLERSYTIAQNKDTCIVYGMPGAAVESGSIDRILPLEDIPGEIIEYMRCV